MTHLPYNPILSLVMWAGIMLAITGLPTVALASSLWERNRLGRFAASSIGAVWLVAYPNTVWLWYRHGYRQRMAAREADCLGYANVMPERCTEALMSTSVVPDGFFFWSAITLGLGVLGLAGPWAPDVKNRLGRITSA